MTKFEIPRKPKKSTAYSLIYVPSHICLIYVVRAIMATLHDSVGCCAESSEELFPDEAPPDDDVPSINEALNSEDVSVLWMAPFFR